MLFRSDVGVHTSDWVYQGFSGSKGIRLTGQVVDIEGKPVAGVMVFALVSDARGQLPSGVSGKTGVDGRFLLPFAEPGQFFLSRVRRNVASSSSEEELYSVVYPNDIPEAVEVLAGPPQDVKVVVRRLPSPENRQSDGVNPTVPSR